MKNLTFALLFLLLIGSPAMSENTVPTERKAGAEAEPAEAETAGDDDRYLSEANLPEGFPKPGPAGEVVEKDYPAYRVAMAPGGERAFWKLFQHIKSHDIAMTAPVEMTLEPAGEDAQGRERVAGYEVSEMMFMYARPDMGELGEDGDVVVQDIPAMKVLSLGWFGRQGGEKAKAATEKLQVALADRQDLKPVGPMRLMGYNSPMVPPERQYFEVQQPVEAVNAMPGE
jgi:hypothetical protein